jgi:hypothetical protein
MGRPVSLEENLMSSSTSEKSCFACSAVMPVGSLLLGAELDWEGLDWEVLDWEVLGAVF